MNNIGNNIKQVRVNKKMTQQEVADKLYVTRQCISRWEIGKTIPDIESLEKLSKVYDITIGEILDDEAIKYLTLQDSRSLKKWQRFSLVYGIISIALFLIIFMGIIWLRTEFKDENFEVELSDIDVEIINITDDTITFEIDHNQEISLDFSNFNGLIYNEYGHSIQSDELLIGNIVNLSYEENLLISHLEVVQVLDHLVEDSIYGIVFNTTEVEYDEWDDLPLTTDPNGLRYIKLSGLNFWEWQHNVQIDNFEISVSELGEYRELLVVDITIYMDYRYITEDAKIGLITSSGIEYVDIINPYYNTSRVYDGEIQMTETYRPNRASIDVIFTIHFINVNAVETFEVYEYDMNHILINQIQYDNVMDFEQHKVIEGTLYSYIKFNYYEGETYSFSAVHKLFLGESIKFHYADEYGLVWHYSYKSQ